MWFHVENMYSLNVKQYIAFCAVNNGQNKLTFYALQDNLHQSTLPTFRTKNSSGRSFITSKFLFLSSCQFNKVPLWSGDPNELEEEDVILTGKQERFLHDIFDANCKRLG